jgi:hypothetical protein
MGMTQEQMLKMAMKRRARRRRRRSKTGPHSHGSTRCSSPVEETRGAGCGGISPQLAMLHRREQHMAQLV